MVAGVPLSDQAPDGRTWGVPADLVDALQEWARVAAALPASGAGAPGRADVGATVPSDVKKSRSPEADDLAAVTVSRRGRQLAARLSVELGVPVDYPDPGTGHRVPLRGITRPPPPPPVPPLPVRATGPASPSPPSPSGPPHPAD